MIISKKYNFIFIHIPKTGGEFVEFNYDTISSWDDLILGGIRWAELLQKRYNEKFKIQKHSKISDLTKILEYSDLINFEIYACIRSPLDRSVSLYNYLKQWNYPIAKKHKDINSFWESNEALTKPGPNELLVKQKKYIENSKNITENLRFKLGIRPNLKLYKFENLNNLLFDISKKVNNKITFDDVNKLKAKNTSKKFFTKDDLSSKSLKNIETRYQEDFKLYDSLS